MYERNNVKTYIKETIKKQHSGKIGRIVIDQ